jgi:hypothetical protein
MWKVTRWKSVNTTAFFVTNPPGSPELKLDERFGLLTVERKPDSEPTDWVTGPVSTGTGAAILK